MKRTIKVHVPCKAPISLRPELIKLYFKALLMSDDFINDRMIEDLQHVCELTTNTAGACRYIYCPVYFACPIKEEIKPGVASRHGMQCKTLIESVEVQQKPELIEQMEFTDGVTDYVVRGDGTIEK